MPEIQRINYRHEAILNWMVANPNRTLGECALELGFTQAWLSTVIHSDAFQMLYRERMASLGEGLVHSVKDRLAGVAGLALEKTAERLERGASDDFLAATTKNALNALGFGVIRGGGGSPITNKVEVHLEEATLVAARERARARFGVEAEVVQTSHGAVPFLHSRDAQATPTMHQEVAARSLPVGRVGPSAPEQLTLAGLLGALGDGE